MVKQPKLPLKSYHDKICYNNIDESVAWGGFEHEYGDKFSAKEYNISNVKEY